MKIANNDDMYVQDYIDVMQRLEAIARDYISYADSRIFSSFIDLSNRLDTPQFCSLVDSNQIGQTGCNVDT